jgi:ABC-2 type transport system permease protein
MMIILVSLLRPHLLTIRNRIRFGSQGQFGLKRDLLLLIIAFIIMGCIFFAVKMTFNFFKGNPSFMEIIPLKLLTVGFEYVFLFVFFTDTVAVTGNVFTADNMNLLLSTPVSNIRLYFAKVIETYVETGVMFFVFIFPALLGYGFALNLPWYFIPVCLAIFLAILAIPLGFAFVISTLIANLLSFVWKRGAIFFPLLVSSAIWALYVFISRLDQVRKAKQGAHALLAMTGIYSEAKPLWYPPRWASDIASTLFSFEGQIPILQCFMLVLASIFSLSLGYLFFDYFLLPVRSGVGSGHIVKNRYLISPWRRDVTRKLMESFLSFFPLHQQIKAIILKDLSNLLRDRAQAIQLLLFLGVFTLYITVANFMGAAFNLGNASARAWYAVLAVMNFLFTGFILTTVLTRLVYPSISLEGKAFWLLQITPIQLSRLIRAKFYCWLPVVMFFGATLLAAGAISIGTDADFVFLSAFLGAVLGIGYTGLALGLGAKYASFHWESPNQISIGLGTLVLLLCSLLLLFALSIPCAVITTIYLIPELYIILGYKKAVTALCFSIILYTAISVCAAWLFCKRGVGALRSVLG